MASKYVPADFPRQLRACPWGLPRAAGSQALGTGAEKPPPLQEPGEVTRPGAGGPRPCAGKASFQVPLPLWEEPTSP